MKKSPDLPLIDYDSQRPIVYPLGTFETRPAELSDIGYSQDLGATAVTAINRDDSPMPTIGDTDRKTYPATLSRPYDLDAQGNQILPSDAEEK